MNINGFCIVGTNSNVGAGWEGFDWLHGGGEAEEVGEKCTVVVGGGGCGCRLCCGDGLNVRNVMTYSGAFDCVLNLV